MSERDSINQRIEAILETQRRRAEMGRRKQAKAEKKATEQEQEDRVSTKRIRGLASRFVTWATMHDIPPDVDDVKALKWSSGHGILKRTSHRFKVGKVPAWIITKTLSPYNDTIYNDENVRPILLVDKDQGLYRSAHGFSKAQYVPVNSYRDLSSFMEEHIHNRIAELCFEHGIEWDVPDPGER